jgi:hypothetical protein
MLFHEPDSTVNLGNMFAHRSRVDGNDWHKILEAFELVVHLDSPNLEIALGISSSLGKKSVASSDMSCCWQR